MASAGAAPAHGQRGRDRDAHADVLFPLEARAQKGVRRRAAVLSEELGREGLADLVDRTCRHAQAIVQGIGALPGAQVAASGGLNQGLVRFLSPELGATEANHDRRTDQVIGAINATGEAFFGGVTWRGRRCMRVSLCNWRTTEADVARAIDAARAVLMRNLVEPVDETAAAD